MEPAKPEPPGRLQSLFGKRTAPLGRRIRARRRNITARCGLASRILSAAHSPPVSGRPGSGQSRRRSLMEVFERVCSSTRFTITAQ